MSHRTHVHRPAARAATLPSRAAQPPLPSPGLTGAASSAPPDQAERLGHRLEQIPVTAGSRHSPGSSASRTSLPEHLSAGVEALSGVALDGVRVHYNSPKPAQLQALAYTQDNTIHVGPGQERHLAHEAWHLVQQKQGRVKPTSYAGGVALNDDARLEQEADVMGRKAAQLQSPPSSAAPLQAKRSLPHALNRHRASGAPHRHGRSRRR